MFRPRPAHVRIVLLLVALAVAAACARSPSPPPTLPARTPVPTWTLPFATDVLTAVATPDSPLRLAVPTGAPVSAPTSAPATPLASGAVPEGTPPTPEPDLLGADARGVVKPPRLVIPDLDLDQEIVPVPIVNGTWDLTSLGEQVGRLTTTGEHPGDDLAMALVGHVTISLGHNGPFYDLRDLRQGDQVIYRAAGRDFVYEIDGQVKTTPDDVGQLYVPDGNRLLLITCSDWSYFWRHYSRRLILSAQLVNVVQSP